MKRVSKIELCEMIIHSGTEIDRLYILLTDHKYEALQTVPTLAFGYTSFGLQQVPVHKA